MSMSHCRNITVDATPYQWKLRGHSRYAGESPTRLILTIRSPAAAFCQVELRARCVVEWYGDGERAARASSLCPRDVARVIQTAVAAGWNPRGRTRQPFRLRGSLELRDYLVTPSSLPVSRPSATSQIRPL